MNGLRKRRKKTDAAQAKMALIAAKLEAYSRNWEVEGEMIWLKKDNKSCKKTNRLANG